MINYMQSEKNDNLWTPYEAIYPLIKYLPHNKKLKIWECCDYGSSKITELLKRQGHEVISTDVIHGFNFLTDVPNFSFDFIITNPPYSLKDAFIEKCYSYGKPFALLLPLTALEGQKRGEMFSEMGISVIVLDKRINFTSKNNVWFNTSWFCWNFFENNKMIFEAVTK
jgi:hypothetical protein